MTREAALRQAALLQGLESGAGIDVRMAGIATQDRIGCADSLAFLSAVRRDAPGHESTSLILQSHRITRQEVDETNAVLAYLPADIYASNLAGHLCGRDSSRTSKALEKAYVTRQDRLTVRHALATPSGPVEWNRSDAARHLRVVTPKAALWEILHAPVDASTVVMLRRAELEHQFPSEGEREGFLARTAFGGRLAGALDEFVYFAPARADVQAEFERHGVRPLVGMPLPAFCRPLERVAALIGDLFDAGVVNTFYVSSPQTRYGDPVGCAVVTLTLAGAIGADRLKFHTLHALDERDLTPLRDMNALADDPARAPYAARAMSHLICESNAYESMLLASLTQPGVEIEFYGEDQRALAAGLADPRLRTVTAMDAEGALESVRTLQSNAGTLLIGADLSALGLGGDGFDLAADAYRREGYLVARTPIDIETTNGTLVANITLIVQATDRQREVFERHGLSVGSSVVKASPLPLHMIATNAALLGATPRRAEGDLSKATSYAAVTVAALGVLGVALREAVNRHEARKVEKAAKAQRDADAEKAAQREQQRIKRKEGARNYQAMLRLSEKELAARNHNLQLRLAQAKAELGLHDDDGEIDAPAKDEARASAVDAAATPLPSAAAESSGDDVKDGVDAGMRAMHAAHANRKAGLRRRDAASATSAAHPAQRVRQDMRSKQPYRKQPAPNQAEWDAIDFKSTKAIAEHMSARPDIEVGLTGGHMTLKSPGVKMLTVALSSFRRDRDMVNEDVNTFLAWRAYVGAEDGAAGG